MLWLQESFTIQIPIAQPCKGYMFVKITKLLDNKLNEKTST